ncbi:MAG: hypothetical protein PWQ91_1239 [Eubacteriales bacterium]|nr:hypothetical protein [Eubacteriales bacterium]
MAGGAVQAIDGGELLTPEEHWLLKFTELRYKQWHSEGRC